MLYIEVFENVEEVLFGDGEEPKGEPIVLTEASPSGLS